MLASVLKTTALVVALLAAWLVVGNAATYAGNVQPRPCHMALTDSSTDQHGLNGTAVKLAQAAGHHHNPASDRDDHCPAGGMCCDALCHAVVLNSDQGVASADARYAFYATGSEDGLISRAVHGLDRPPRTDTL